MGERFGARFMISSSSCFFSKTDFEHYFFKVVRIEIQLKNFDTRTYEAKCEMSEGFETSRIGNSPSKHCAVTSVIQVLLNVRSGLILAESTIVCASKGIRSIQCCNAPIEVHSSGGVRLLDVYCVLQVTSCLCSLLGYRNL